MLICIPSSADHILSLCYRVGYQRHKGWQQHACTRLQPGSGRQVWYQTEFTLQAAHESLAAALVTIVLAAVLLLLLLL